MDRTRKQFVEPEIVKHEDKMADVTLSVGSPDQTDDCLNCPS
jgi:hypothetical protein